MWTKIFLILGLWWLWRFATRMGRRARKRRDEVGGAPRDRKDLDDLTRQDISDADYEEIP